MFGYVKCDKPHLYIKDFYLYNAIYCGVCKGIRNTCGQLPRIGLSYDVAFFSAILHNIKNVDVKITKQRCVEHMIIPRRMAETDELTDRLGALNTILAYYKLTDDMEDEKKGGFKRSLFKKGYKRVKKEQGDIDGIVKRYMKAQAKTEKANVASVDIAADATAQMITDLSDLFLESYATDYTRGLFYARGKWIYLIDALDDYDKDIKKKNYNPFFLVYGEESKAALIEKHADDLRFTFGEMFRSIAENRQNILFQHRHDR